MKEKLYPPYIEGTIPAFYGTTLIVPFSMNKAVSSKNVGGMQIKVKSIQNGSYLLTKNTKDIFFSPSCQAIFDFTEEASQKKLKVGQHYKIQIAYIDKNNETIGYFSTVAVVKYTEKPEVEISGLETGINAINTHQYDYIGTYYNKDSSEKLYSYCFNLYDEKDNLIHSSGIKIYNSENDEQISKYTIEQDLEKNKSYYLEYVVITSNNLQASSYRYRIMQKQSIDPEVKAKIIPELNFENGYIDVKLIGEKNEDGVEIAATGTFKILRASDEDNYKTWHEILKFALNNQPPSRQLWRDFTTKQGITYKYALQQYNSFGLTSNRIESIPVYSDFEHAFLYDGIRQLKVKYNPKINNLKNNLLESKIDTIGGKYPFIFRNGNIKYKEFAISGLISCQSDDEFLFVDEDSFNQYDYSLNLTSGNISSEREFKLNVLEWLNDGNPKIFRSPTEGNYIVRLMNVSLTPTDTVGRMLHSFNSTAYEIAEYSYKSLSDLNLISIKDIAAKQLYQETIRLNANEEENLLKHEAVSLYFEDMNIGDEISVVYKGTSLKIKHIIENDEDAKKYIIAGLRDNLIITKVFVNSSFEGGLMTYSYYTKGNSRFNLINNISLEDSNAEFDNGGIDIIKEIEDINTKVQYIYNVCFLLDETAIDSEESTKIYINENSEIDLADSKEYMAKNLEGIYSIKIGSAVKAQISYQKQIIEYIEDQEV